jgi:hypothetical protein
MLFNRIDDKIFKKIRAQYPEFIADPKSEDPTIQSGENAFAILAMKEPIDRRFASIPEVARQQKDRIKEFARHEKRVSPPPLQAAWQRFISDVGYACEQLNTPSKAEQHLDKLRERRTRTLREYCDASKRIANDFDFVDKIRTHAVRIGITEPDIDKVVDELVKCKSSDGTPELASNPRPVPSEIYEKFLGRRSALLVLLSFILTIAAISVLFNVSTKYDYKAEDKSEEPSRIIIDDVVLLYVRPYSLVFRVDTRMVSDDQMSVYVSCSDNGQWQRAKIVSSSPLDGKSDSEGVRFMCRLEWEATPRKGSPVRFRVVASDGRESAVFEKPMVGDTTSESQ